MTENVDYKNNFSLDTYKYLLQVALNEYQICSFNKVDEANNFILWRHDIDFSLDAACEISKIDAAAGMQSTFFVNLCADTYNATSPTGKRCMNSILEDGHQIGIHVDLSFHGDTSKESELEAILERERHQFISVLDYEPQVFSFHNPSIEIQSFQGSSYAGMVNSYAPMFFNEVAYVSDSNGYWRFKTIGEVLESPDTQNVQVLTHPEWWLGTLQKPRERLMNVLISDVIRRVSDYDEQLEAHGRSNISDYLVELNELKEFDNSIHEVFSVLASYGLVPNSIDWTLDRSSVNQVRSVLNQLLRFRQKHSQ